MASEGKPTAVQNEDSLPKKKHQQKDDWFADLEVEVKPFLELQRESALNLKTMRHYELMYLVHEAKVDELEDIVKKFSVFVREKKGRIWRLNDWGMRRLAYKIKKTWRANYILMNIEIGSEYINELDRLLEKDERIIRHMIMKEEKAITEPCPPPEELPPSSQELRELELAAQGIEIEDEDEGDDYVGGMLEDEGEDEGAQATINPKQVDGTEEDDKAQPREIRSKKSRKQPSKKSQPKARAT